MDSKAEKYNPYSAYAKDLEIFKKLSPTDLMRMKDAITSKASYSEATIIFENDNIQISLMRETRVGLDAPYLIGLSIEEDTVTDGFNLLLDVKRNGVVGFSSSRDIEFFRKLDDIFDFLKNI